MGKYGCFFECREAVEDVTQTFDGLNRSLEYLQKNGA